ncbi:MAG: germination protein YpeB [Halanaerobiales bacterium]
MVGLLIFGVTGYWGYTQYQEKQQLQVYIGNKYQQSFYELVDHVEQLQVLLGKSLVSNSPRQNILLLTDVWSHSNTAQAELNKLPLAAQTVYSTSKFLAQAGDFAHVKARQNADGMVLNTEDRNTLRELREHAIQVAETLQEVESDVLGGNINWVELVNKTKQRISGNEEVEQGTVNDGFDDISEEVTKVPTLIYDGPFSDNIADRKPRELKGDKLTKEDIRPRVEEVLDIDNKEDLEISDGTTVNGIIPSFNFQAETGNGVYSVDFSRTGGYLVSLLNNREVNNSKISQKEAVDRARDYLASSEYPSMEATYSEIKNNIGFISLAYTKDDITFYPDIINVQVALDNGQILAVEALNYLMSHHTREMEEPEISEETARELAGQTLEKIENVRLAVIPQPALKELLTYEIRGTTEDETYLIYINAATGNEEQILKVVKEEKGTFAL